MYIVNNFFFRFESCSHIIRFRIANEVIVHVYVLITNLLCFSQSRFPIWMQMMMYRCFLLTFQCVVCVIQFSGILFLILKQIIKPFLKTAT